MGLQTSGLQMEYTEEAVGYPGGSYMNRLISVRSPSGTWENYQTWQAGTIDLHRGRGQLIVTAPENPPFALIDLRAIRLIPPK